MSGIRNPGGAGVTATRAVRSASAAWSASVGGVLAMFIAMTSMAQAPVGSSQHAADLERRLARMERQLSANTMFELLERIEALQRDVRSLRGELEMQGHEISQLKKRQREVFVELDRVATSAPAATAPVAVLPPVPASESTNAAAPAAPIPAPAPSPVPERATPEPAPVAVASPSPTSSAPLAEQAAYQKAFTLLQDAQYEKATKAFQAFLKTYPSGQYADNAQYWLAESFYVTRAFPDSMREFETLAKRYPQSPKLPGAQLKIGFIHQALGDKAKAKAALSALVAKYPGTTAARLAEDRLRQLK